MALIRCTKCGHEISDKAKTCIYCGKRTDDILRDLADQKAHVLIELKKAYKDYLTSVLNAYHDLERSELAYHDKVMEVAEYKKDISIATAKHIINLESNLLEDLFFIYDGATLEFDFSCIRAGDLHYGDLVVSFENVVKIEAIDTAFAYICSKKYIQKGSFRIDLEELDRHSNWTWISNNSKIPLYTDYKTGIELVKALYRDQSINAANAEPSFSNRMRAIKERYSDKPCPDCGNIIDRKDDFCSVCGYPITEIKVEAYIDKYLSQKKDLLQSVDKNRKDWMDTFSRKTNEPTYKINIRFISSCLRQFDDSDDIMNYIGRSFVLCFKNYKHQRPCITITFFDEGYAHLHSAEVYKFIRDGYAKKHGISFHSTPHNYDGYAFDWYDFDLPIDDAMILLHDYLGRSGDEALELISNDFYYTHDTDFSFDNGIEYEKIDKEGLAMITKIHELQEKQKTPKIDGEPVHRRINGDFLLTGTKLDKYVGDSEVVCIPEGITTVSSVAFINTCVNKLIMSSTVTCINGLFKTTRIEELILNKKIKTIENYVFEDHKRLKSINLDSVINIGKEAFAGCENLTCVNLSNIKSIDAEAFKNCTQLSNITINPNVAFINSSAFSNTAYANDELNWHDGQLIINGVLISTEE